MLERSKLRANSGRLPRHHFMNIWTKRSRSPLVRIWLGRFNLDAVPLLSKPKTPAVELLEKSRPKKRPDFSTVPQPLVTNDGNYVQ